MNCTAHRCCSVGAVTRGDCHTVGVGGRFRRRGGFVEEMFDPAGDGEVRQAVHFRQLARSHCLGKYHAFDPLRPLQFRSLLFSRGKSKANLAVLNLKIFVGPLSLLTHVQDRVPLRRNIRVGSFASIDNWTIIIGRTLYFSLCTL